MATRPTRSKLRNNNKYNARGSYYEGVYFHSQGELARYKDLQILEKAKKITSLERQIKFPLKIGNQLITNFICDFMYGENGQTVIEDFKGFYTPESKLKHKMFRALYPEYELRITTKKTNENRKHKATKVNSLR